MQGSPRWSLHHRSFWKKMISGSALCCWPFSESQACRGHSHPRIFAPAILLPGTFSRLPHSQFLHYLGLSSDVTSQGAFSDPSGTSSDPPLLRPSCYHHLFISFTALPTLGILLSLFLLIHLLSASCIGPSQALFPPSHLLALHLTPKGTTCVCEKMGECTETRVFPARRGAFI